MLVQVYYWELVGVGHGIFERVVNIIEKQRCSWVKKQLCQLPFKSKTIERQQKVETSLYNKLLTLSEEKLWD